MKLDLSYSHLTSLVHEHLKMFFSCWLNFCVNKTQKVTNNKEHIKLLILNVELENLIFFMDNYSHDR
jgi:hypothetical protein